jgi:hypothetical protein
LHAADTAEPHDRAELQRLAAEQLLRTGHLDEGLIVLEGLARELGIWLAPKRWQQVLSLMLHRVRARLPAFGGRTRTPSVRASRQLMMLDVYWSFFVGLVNYDAIRAMDFHARHMVLAARVGDRQQIALSLAAEASTRAALTGQDSRRIRDLIAKARALCADIQSPDAVAFISISEALCALLTADWERASRLAKDADTFLCEHCSGVAWERATMIGVVIEASFHRGAWATIAEYAQSFPGRIEDARTRGDVHAIVASMFEETFRLLIADQPALADQFVRDAMSELPRKSRSHGEWGARILTQDLYAIALQAPIALYMGDGNRAWTLIDRPWRELAKSQFLRVEHASVVALHMRASAAIGIAALSDEAKDRLGEALKCAHKLARKRSQWPAALSLLIRAGVASVRGEREQTRDLLERAEDAFRTVGMAHFIAVCQYRRGALTGGDEARTLIAAAEAWATSHGVVNPARMFDMLAPGRWEPLRSPASHLVGPH